MRLKMIGLLALAAAPLGMTALRAQAPEAAEPAWVPSFAAGAALAKQNGRPLFVVFR